MDALPAAPTVASLLGRSTVQRSTMSTVHAVAAKLRTRWPPSGSDVTGFVSEPVVAKIPSEISLREGGLLEERRLRLADILNGFRILAVAYLDRVLSGWKLCRRISHS